MRNKIKYKNNFLRTPAFWALLHSKLFYLLPLSGTGDGMGVVVNSSHAVSPSPSSARNSSHGRTWDPMGNSPPWTSPAWRRTACLTTVFITGCRQISSPAFGAPPHPSSALTSVSAELLSHICHSQLLHRFFLPFLKYDTTVTDGLGFGQWWVPLGVSCSWLCQTWRQLLAVCQRSYTCSLHSPEGYQNLAL